MNSDELTGRARTHLMTVPDLDCLLHKHVVVPFLNLRRVAMEVGIELVPLSSFRDFERQLALWNGKFTGARPMYDAAGRVIDVSSMSQSARVTAILQWSALPGASRHHWGTDLDLIDRRATPPEYRVQLTPQEFSPPGPFAPLAAWLADNAPRYGFFRPFRGIHSGVQSEPWHFSFAPIAENARRALSLEILQEALADAPMLGKEYVLPRLDELHARYVARIDWP